MNRRIFSICLVLGFLAFALLVLTTTPVATAQAQALTATRTYVVLTPCGTIIRVATSTPSPTVTPTRTATATATACTSYVYITPTPGVPTFTPTPTRTGLPNADFVGAPLSGAAPLTVQFTYVPTTSVQTYTWDFGDGTTCNTCGFTPTHTYTAAGSYTVSLNVIKLIGLQRIVTKTDYIVVTAPGQLTPTPTITPSPTGTTNSTLPDLTITSLTYYYGSYPACANKPLDSVVVTNNGSSAAGTFVVAFSANGVARTPQTVNGLGAGQNITLYFSAGMSVTATVDSTGVIAEANESNNTATADLPVPTQSPTCTPTALSRSQTPWVTPTRTWTPGTSTLTRTPTRTFTPTPYSTACDVPGSCGGVTGTPATKTLTPTFTPTTRAGTCTPVTGTITAPFAYDGAGTFCWQSANLGTYVNSWNLTDLTINGYTYTNLYVPAGSYPAQINGYWYVGYTTPRAGQSLVLGAQRFHFYSLFSYPPRPQNAFLKRESAFYDRGLISKRKKKCSVVFWHSVLV